MMRAELDEGMTRRKLGDTQRGVIVVKHHKTGRLRPVSALYMSPCTTFTGQKESALLVVDATSISMLLLWQRVLCRILPDSSLAFPEFDGTKLGHPERKMGAAAKSLGHILPTPTGFRKDLEIRNKRQEGPMREAVSRALAHSLSTAQQYYQAPTLSDTYKAYQAIDEIIRGERATSPGLTKEKVTAKKCKGNAKVMPSSSDTEGEQSDSYLEDDGESGQPIEEKGKGKGKGKERKAEDGKGKERKGEKGKERKGEKSKVMAKKSNRQDERDSYTEEEKGKGKRKERKGEAKSVMAKKVTGKRRETATWKKRGGVR